MILFNKDSFISTEPVLAKLFVEAKKTGHLAHAFLLCGDSSSPLLESALYLAESLNCEKETLACSSCPSCKRFEEGIHPDFVLINGEDSTIKKSDINQLEDFFSLSATERNHKSSYVINHIENITSEAINALLKFLEEPKGDIVAFLTTNNINKVLPTICSRCEIVRLRSTNFEELVDKYEGDISLDRYYLISHFTYDEDKKKEIDESKDFSSSYDAATKYVESLVLSPVRASYTLLLEAGDKLKSNKCYNYFYSIINCCCTRIGTIVFGTIFSYTSSF